MQFYNTPACEQQRLEVPGLNSLFPGPVLGRLSILFGAVIRSNSAKSPLLPLTGQALPPWHGPVDVDRPESQGYGGQGARAPASPGRKPCPVVCITISSCQPGESQVLRTQGDGEDKLTLRDPFGENFG